MSRFRFRKIDGPPLPFLVLFILFNFAGFTGAGTAPSSSSKISFVLARPSVHSTDDAAFNNGFLKRTLDVDVAERRGAPDYHGRTLLFKSLILAPLALVVLILLTVLLIPIPVISSPLVGTGKMLPSSYYSSSLSPMQVAREILTAEECVERVSCELSRISRSYDSTSWIPPALEKLLLRMKWSERIIRGLQGISEPGDSCAQFLCSPAKTIRRSLTSSTIITAR